MLFHRGMAGEGQGHEGLGEFVVVDRWMDWWIYGWFDWWMDGLMDWLMDGLIDGDGWINGLIDGWID